MTDQEFKKHKERSSDDCMKAIFDEYCNYVYIIAATKLKSCGVVEDVEECVSDVFAEVFKKIDYLGEREGDLKGFIGVIAKRKAIDMYQSLKMFLNASSSFSDLKVSTLSLIAI